jgi:succinate dehydrogenase/fumarate reductase cytochrome b subunit
VASQSSWTLRTYHLVSAIVLGLFVALHLANHIVGLTGQGQHVAFMHSVRPLYRNPVVEPLLLALFAAQIVTGVTLVVRGWRTRRGLVPWLQAGSGLYLAAFVILHVLAVLSGRAALALDTDFRFAAAGFHVLGWPWYFWPYYTLAVFALFTHIGCAIYWNILDRSSRTARSALRTMVGIGAVAGLSIASALAGLLFPVDIPAAYKATYTGD